MPKKIVQNVLHQILSKRGRNLLEMVVDTSVVFKNIIVITAIIVIMDSRNINALAVKLQPTSSGNGYAIVLLVK